MNKNPVLIPVGGGKGGVGKSLTAANLAAALAKLGKQVIVVDLDLGGSNLYSYPSNDFRQFSSSEPCSPPP